MAKFTAPYYNARPRGLKLALITTLGHAQIFFAITILGHGDGILAVITTLGHAKNNFRFFFDFFFFQKFFL